MQVIKLLVRSFRRLRLFFCGFFKRPAAPLHAPPVSLNPVESRAAPSVLLGLSYSAYDTINFYKSNRFSNKVMYPVDDKYKVTLGLELSYENYSEQEAGFLLQRDDEILARYKYALQRTKLPNPTSCSSCGKSSRNKKYCDVCYAWRKTFIAWYRKDPIGNGLYKLIYDTLYIGQVTNTTFKDYVEMAEEARKYRAYEPEFKSANYVENYDIAHLFPKSPKNISRIGLHTRNNLILIPSFINRRMGNYVFSDEIGESLLTEGKRRILKNKWLVISKKFKFIEQFKKIHWFKEKRQLDNKNQVYSPERLMAQNYERFSIELLESHSFEDKWTRLLMHCLKSEDIEMESPSGLHSSLIGFGTEYPTRIEFYLKGMDEEYFEKWCKERNYNPKDDDVLNAIEWFIHWRAVDEEGSWVTYETYKHLDVYDSRSFSFLLEVYSASIRLIIKVFKGTSTYDMNLKYVSPEQGRWLFPEWIKFEGNEIQEKTDFLLQYFKISYYDWKEK